tara:strand:- start:426 stop:1346 length:921 start_codon:yes stop_codon:yes gene_type:complete
MDNPNTFIAPSELNFSEIFRVLWQKKIAIIINCAIAGAILVYYSLSLTNIYKSDAVLYLTANSPNVVSSGNSFGDSGLSSLAALAGADIESDISKDKLAIKTIQSREFLNLLINKDDFLPRLMAQGSFNKSNGTFQYNSEVYDEINKVWVEDGGQSLKPKFHQIYKKYTDSLDVDKNLETGFIEISFTHISPYVAQQKLSLIIKEVNNLLREKDIIQSKNSIDYLTGIDTPVQDVKRSIAILIQQSLQTEMFANIQENYVLDILDSPHAPELKSAPARALICIVGTMFVFLLSCLYFLARHYYKEN